MQHLLLFCSICLHIFNLGFQDPSLTPQRDSACATCMSNLLNEPQINLYRDLDYTDKNEPSFDYRLLPIFRQSIEEKIQYAYENTELEDLKKPFLSGGLSIGAHTLAEMSRKFFNLMREVYDYEKDVKGLLEEQKQEVLKKIAQKIDDVTLASQKLGGLAELTQRTNLGMDFDFEKVGKNMEEMSGIMRELQKEAKNAAEVLVVNETINSMKEHSKRIADCYTKYEEFRRAAAFGPSTFSERNFENSWRILTKEFGERTIPKKHPGFEKILLKFEITLEEISKEIDHIQYFCMNRWSRLEKRVEERLDKLSQEEEDLLKVEKLNTADDDYL